MMIQRYIVNNILRAAFIISGTILLSFNSLASPMPDGLTISGVDIADKDADEIKEIFSSIKDILPTASLTIDIDGKDATKSLDDLGLDCGNIDEAIDTFEQYTTGNIIQRFISSQDLKDNPVDISIDIKLDDSKVDEFLDIESSELAASASDATMTRENGKFIITEGHDGIGIDKEATKEKINKALISDISSTDIKVQAVTNVQKAKITKEDLETIQDNLGTFTTDFSSSGAARSKNLQTGAAKINGHVLMPGEMLSGYECMQPFTKANGYETAAAYENGQVVDSVGGGACQVATTLYNAALRAELTITQRQNHSMIVGYVQPSADAAIAGTYKDIKITNNWSTPIYVEGYTSGKKITFTIWGKETRDKNRTLEFESKILSTNEPAPTYIEDPSLPAGKQVKIQSSHTGRKSQLWKIVKVDGVETERTLLSTDTYNASAAIYRVGTGASIESAEIAPTETEAAPAETVAPIEGINGGPGVVSPAG